MENYKKIFQLDVYQKLLHLCLQRSKYMYDLIIYKHEETKKTGSDTQFLTKLYPILFVNKNNKSMHIPFTLETMEALFHNQDINLPSNILQWLACKIYNTSHDRLCYVIIMGKYAHLIYLPIINNNIIHDLSIRTYIANNITKDILEFFRNITVINFTPNKKDKRDLVLAEIKTNPFGCLAKSDKFYRICLWCNKYDISAKVCSGCNSVYYCNLDCQRNHWKIHKKQCNILKYSHNKSHFSNICCNNCNQYNMQAKICNKCNLVYYCNADCQKNNWENHKSICEK